MTFLDQRLQQVRDETAHDRIAARLGGPLMGLPARTPAAGLKCPMGRYMNYAPSVEPEDFDACPVLLTAEDRWTPHHLSVPVLSRITKVPVDTVMLDN
ncbi:hypothetical protein [Streptomyces griseofuscus]|uniref:hypothetical protein n=1 Tax=Streptomyces griseofuscus TaxID=146922 RepID=UPI0037205E68